MNKHILGSTLIYASSVKALERADSSTLITRIKKYKPLLHKIAIGLGLTEKDCHEIVTCICLYEVKNYLYKKENLTLRIWLLRRLIHKCIFTLSSQMFSQNNTMESSPAHYTIPYYGFVSQFSQMPLSYRTIYLLFNLNEFTEMEIAQILNINRLQVQERIRKARSMIKNS